MNISINDLKCDLHGFFQPVSIHISSIWRNTTTNSIIWIYILTLILISHVSCTYNFTSIYNEEYHLQYLHLLLTLHYTLEIALFPCTVLLFIIWSYSCTTYKNVQYKTQPGSCYTILCMYISITDVKRNVHA